MSSPKQFSYPASITAILRAVAAAAAIGVGADAMSAEPHSIDSPAYKLRTENPDTFRLTPTNAIRPASTPGKEEKIRARLADRPFASQIAEASRESALDPALVHALIYVESRYQPAARSPKGALGLMQVLPETASRYGVANAGRSIEANLRAGTRYLRDLMGIFDGRLELVLAAYNAGENAVLRHGQHIPPYRETQEYVPAVLEKYREWQEHRSAAVPMQQRIEYLPGTHLAPPAHTDPKS
jgi:soluble lytic murein transglycosylase-like protein